MEKASDAEIAAPRLKEAKGTYLEFRSADAIAKRAERARSEREDQPEPCMLIGTLGPQYRF